MIKRHSKENKVIEFLEGIGREKEPIEVFKGFVLCNPKLYSEMYIVRLREAVTQEIYNVTIGEVARLKRLLDAKK